MKRLLFILFPLTVSLGYSATLIYRASTCPQCQIIEISPDGSDISRFELNTDTKAVTIDATQLPKVRISSSTAYYDENDGTVKAK